MNRPWDRPEDRRRLFARTTAADRLHPENTSTSEESDDYGPGYFEEEFSWETVSALSSFAIDDQAVHPAQEPGGNWPGSDENASIKGGQSETEQIRTALLEELEELNLEIEANQCEARELSSALKRCKDMHELLKSQVSMVTQQLLDTTRNKTST